MSGSSLGGGTFWGLCRLLTGANDFDEILELSATGDNSKIDMLVGDIYGGLDYAKIGLSASTIASSFGKVVSERNKARRIHRFAIAHHKCSIDCLVHSMSSDILSTSYIVHALCYMYVRKKKKKKLGSRSLSANLLSLRTLSLK